MDEIPLVLHITLQEFNKWVVDFVGPINLVGKRTGGRYIITVTDYLTRWVEEVLVKDRTAVTTPKFYLKMLSQCSYAQKL